MYTSPGGRFFDLWEFSREVFESILQILAVREYANNGNLGYLTVVCLMCTTVLKYNVSPTLTTPFPPPGVDRAFLDIYVCVVGINALSAVALILPQCAPKRWNRMSRESRARRERVVLTLDVVCDALCTFECYICFWWCTVDEKRVCKEKVAFGPHPFLPTLPLSMSQMLYSRRSIWRYLSTRFCTASGAMTCAIACRWSSRIVKTSKP